MTTKQLSLYFFVVHLVLTIVMAAIILGLNVAFEAEIGGAGPFISILIGSIILAGRKFASLEDTPPSSGRYWRLSFGMTAAAMVGNLISALALGDLIVPDLSVAALASDGLAMFLAVLSVIMAIVQLAIIRFAFGYFSRREIETRIAAKLDNL
jgi:hypothetical protein